MSLSKVAYQAPDLSDPKVFGPGGWFTLHSMSYEADTPEKEKAFYTFLSSYVRNLKCLECRGHATKFLEMNPYDRYCTNSMTWKGRRCGAFKYIFDFHNAVNDRLGKPTVDWTTAWSLYSNPDANACHQCSRKTSPDNMQQQNSTVGSNAKRDTDIRTVNVPSVSDRVTGATTSRVPIKMLGR